MFSVFFIFVPILAGNPDDPSCLQDSHFWFVVAERVGVHVVECACVIELPGLKVCMTLQIWCQKHPLISCRLI